MSASSFSIRKLINDLHLWLGIASGLILFVVCLSGTIYVFRAEIERAIEPEKYTVAFPDGQTPMAPERLIEAVIETTGGTASSITVDSAPDAPWVVNVKKNADDRRGSNYLVNPYTAEVLGNTKGPATGFFMVMFKLHRWLLLPTAIGRPVVGVATIIFVILCITGLVLWWPKRFRQMKQGLRVKLSSNWKRINYDLHNVLGFYSLLLLVVMGLSGLCWSFEWYRDGLGNLLGAKVFDRSRPEQPVLENVPSESGSIADFAAVANSLFPYAGQMRIAFPAKDQTLVSVGKQKSGFFALHAHDVVVINKFTLEPVEVSRFSEKPLGAQIAGSIHAIHLGDIYGTFSKILYFISCLIATSLPITGTIIWINKLKKKRKRRC